MRQWSAIKTLVNAAKTFPMRLVNAVFVNRWTSAGVNRHGVTAALVSGLHCTAVMPRLHLIHVARIQVVSTCSISICIAVAVYMIVPGYKLLARDACRRLHESGVNAA